MKKNRLRRLRGAKVKRLSHLSFLPFCLLTLLPFYPYAFVSAEPLQQVDKQIKGEREKLNQLKKKINDLDAQRKKLKQEEESLRRTIARLDKEISASVKKQVDLQKKIRLMETQLAKTKKMVHSYQQDQEMWEESFLNDLRAYHARFSYPQRLKSSPLKRKAAQEQIEWKLSNMKNASYQKTFYQDRELNYSLAVLKLASAKEELEQEIEKQKKAQQEKNKLYQTTMGKRVIAEQNVKELQETAESLEKLLSELVRKKQKTLAELRDAEMAKRTMGEKRGELPWPVEGKVTSFFGRHLHPELKVPVLNNGIRIKTEPKSMVKSVEQGTVIYASDFRSYGQTVIVEHAGDYFSIYGLLGSIEVKEGESVSAGKSLGRSAAEADSQIYFEWRVGGRSEDPLLWLR